MAAIRVQQTQCSLWGKPQRQGLQLNLAPGDLFSDYVDNHSGPLPLFRKSYGFCLIQKSLIRDPATEGGSTDNRNRRTAQFEGDATGCSLS